MIAVIVFRGPTSDLKHARASLQEALQSEQAAYRVLAYKCGQIAGQRETMQGLPAVFSSTVISPESDFCVPYREAAEARVSKR